MKNFIKSPLGIIVSFFVLLLVYSILGPRLPLSILTQQKGEPLMVTEEGKTTVVPDVAKISLGIEETGSNLKSVQDSVNTKSKDLVTLLKKLGIDEKDIKSVSYNVYPEYNYDSRPTRITGYRVSTTYEVTIENFEKVNEIISQVTLSGVNTIGNVSFELSDNAKQEALQKARDEAVEKAKTKAKSLAKAAGISLGKIINITENTNQNIYPTPLYAKDRAIGMGSEELIAQPDIQPGETEITTSITISWEIK